jgi:hypothetical protein
LWSDLTGKCGELEDISEHEDGIFEFHKIKIANQLNNW